MLGIKYIVTTWFQRFINKLTDHLVSIRSDRSTNPGISALGLVGGGRWWLSMRGDIEGKSPCRFQGGLLLTLFQRGSMCVQAPFTPPVFQSLRESRRGLHEKQRSVTLTFYEVGRIQAGVCCIPCSHERCSKQTQISCNWHSPRASARLLALASAEAGKNHSGRWKGTLSGWCHSNVLDSFPFHYFDLDLSVAKHFADFHLFQIFHKFPVLCSSCKEQGHSGEG